MATPSRKRKPAKEEKAAGQGGSSLGTLSTLISLVADPFRILRDLKEYRHLLKPTPFQFFFLLAVAIGIWIIELLLDLIGVGVFVNVIINWLLVTPFMFGAFWFCGASYDPGRKEGSASKESAAGSFFKRVLTNLATDIIETLSAGILPIWVVNVLISTSISWSGIIIKADADGNEQTVADALKRKRQAEEGEAILEEELSVSLPRQKSLPAKTSEGGSGGKESAGDGTRPKDAEQASDENGERVGYEFRRNSVERISEERPTERSANLQEAFKKAAPKAPVRQNASQKNPAGKEASPENSFRKEPEGNIANKTLPQKDNSGKKPNYIQGIRNEKRPEGVEFLKDGVMRNAVKDPF